MVCTVNFDHSSNSPFKIVPHGDEKFSQSLRTVSSIQFQSVTPPPQAAFLPPPLTPQMFRDFTAPVAPPPMRNNSQPYPSPARAPTPMPRRRRQKKAPERPTFKVPALPEHSLQRSETPLNNVPVNPALLVSPGPQFFPPLPALERAATPFPFQGNEVMTNSMCLAAPPPPFATPNLPFNGFINMMPFPPFFPQPSPDFFVPRFFPYQWPIFNPLMHANQPFFLDPIEAISRAATPMP